MALFWAPLSAAGKLAEPADEHYEPAVTPL